MPVASEKIAVDQARRRRLAAGGATAGAEAVSVVSPAPGVYT
jgi:hypothetical protein